MFRNLALPTDGAGLFVLAAITGGILVVWSLPFIRNNLTGLTGRYVFWGLLVTVSVSGTLAACIRAWVHPPSLDFAGVSYRSSAEIQAILFLSLLISLIAVPLAVWILQRFSGAIQRATPRRGQFSLFMLLIAIGMTGPAVYFANLVYRSPEVAALLAAQYATFGIALAQITRKSHPLESIESISRTP